MKFGVLFPQTQIGTDPGAVREVAQAVEALGYDYLMAYEHVLGADPHRPGWKGFRPYTYEDAFHEPFTLFAFLAAVTRRIELVTAILVLPQRQTALVAKQAAEVDLLSGGRFRLGVGVGWNDAEYEGMGTSFRDRGRRLEEQVAVLRALWTRPLVNFQGAYHRLERVGINPLPTRAIPLWMGGGADAVLRRLARLAEGWFMPALTLERAGAALGRLKGYLAAEGRHIDGFGVDARLNLGQVPAEAWPGWIAEREKLGVSHVAAVPAPGWTEVTAFLKELERFKAALGL